VKVLKALFLLDSTRNSQDVALKKTKALGLICLFLFTIGLELNAQSPDSLSQGQEKLEESALSLLGAQSLKFKDASFTYDCSGVVMASLWKAGLDLRHEYAQGSGNGVRRIYSYIVEQKLDYTVPLPEIGDLIFWDNTYDRNNNKKWDDDLSHIGIVVAVDDDGTISYVHHDYTKGITVAKMNLLYPDLRDRAMPDGSRKLINSPLRMQSQRYLNPDLWLSSHLFRSFARTRLLMEGH